MGFAYEEPDSGGSDTSGTTTTSTDSVTTYDDYSENISTTDTDGGFATSDPYAGETYESTSTTQQGGEHTYDVDDSVGDDPTLDYSPINDPRQTADETEGTAGGWAPSHQETGWAGGIGAGLGGEEQEGSLFPTGYGGTLLSSEQRNQLNSVYSTTHDDDGDHTTDSLPTDFDLPEPDYSGNGEPGGNATDRLPTIPSVPEFPDPGDQDAMGVGLLLAAAVFIYVGFREVVARGS